MTTKPEVWFYQVGDGTLGQALGALLERCLAKPWKAAVIAQGADRLGELNALLWSYRDDSFLPHGLADDPAAAQFPIVLCEQWNGSDRPATLVLDGCALAIGAGVERCMVVFEEGSQARQTAREQWKQASAGGYKVSYWLREENGAWTQKA
jgi:DNA polymerase-3 subunit chi